MNIANRVPATKTSARWTSARWVIGAFLVLLLLLLSALPAHAQSPKRGGGRRQPNGHKPRRVRPPRTTR